MLEGFKTINLTIGLPYISVTCNGLTFNKTAIVKLEKPSRVLLMLNEAEKKLAVQPCDEENEDATLFLKNKNASILSVRWNNKDLLYTISKMMGWDLTKYGYRIDGDYLGSEKAMIFDLNTAKILGDRDE